MAEQTLVITLFIEHSDMHIYVGPKKEGEEEACDLSSDVESVDFLRRVVRIQIQRCSDDFVKARI